MTAVTVKELKEILATTKAPRKLCDPVTGKSLSEALILGFTSSMHENYKIRTWGKHDVHTNCFLVWHSEQFMHMFWY